jgi:hypothetical protein
VRVCVCVCVLCAFGEHECESEHCFSHAELKKKKDKLQALLEVE